MIKMRKCLGLMLLLGFAITCAALADDGGVIGVGGAVELMHPEHSSVRMVSERVDVKITRGIEQWEVPTAKVRCVFYFRNEGPATTVKMGFPEDSYADAVDTRSMTSKLEHFQSWVDGKRIGTRLLLDKKNHGQTFGAWHVKDVPFARGQTRKIVDTYTGGIGAEVGGTVWFEYTLQSGASWKGSIGEAVIRVDASALRSRYGASASPGGYVERGGIFTWTLRNLEPTKDIDVSFSPRTYVYVNEDWKQSAFYERASDGVTMAYLRPLLEDVKGVTIKSDGKTCTIARAGHVLELVRGSKTATLSGGRRIALPRAPFLNRNGLIVPAASVARALGGTAKRGTGMVGYGSTGYYLRVVF